MSLKKQMQNLEPGPPESLHSFSVSRVDLCFVLQVLWAIQNMRNKSTKQERYEENTFKIPKECKRIAGNLCQEFPQPYGRK